MKLDKKTISQFYKQYAENLDKVMYLEQEQREQGTNIIEWIGKYKEKAKSIRETFVQNEEGISKILSPILTEETPLDDKLAEYFLDEIVDLRKGYYGDSLVTYEVLKVILAYYEANPPKELDNYIITLALIAAYEDVLSTEEHLTAAVEYNTKVISYADQYTKFKKPEAQRRMFYAFHNRILSENKRRGFTCERMFQFGEEALEFYNNPKNRKVEGYPYEEYQNSVHKRCNLSALSFPKSDLNCPIGLFSYACDDAIRQYEGYRRRGETDETMDLLVYLNYVLASYRSDKMGGMEAFERLYNTYKSVNSEIDYNDVRYLDGDIFEVMNHYMPELIVLVEWSGYPQTRVQEIKKSIIEDVLRFYAAIPPGKRNDVTNNFMLAAFRHVLPYYNMSGEALERIMETIIARDSTTAIHTNMVKTLAAEVTKSVVRNKPELLVRSNGYRSVDAVKENIKEILSYVRLAAFCHDIGKLAIADIINIQYRKITKTELKVIKTHPEVGSDILRTIPCLRQYEDIALGHHRNFDGKGGYPPRFNNRKSPFALFIDIITICDCIDAATDSLGRIYKKAKTYEEVLQEMQEGSGTKYNPELIDLLVNDSALREMIKYIVSDGRDTYLFAVYKHMDK